MHKAEKDHQPTAAGSPSPIIKLPLALLGHAGYLLSLVMLVIVSILILMPLSPWPGKRRALASWMLRRYLRFFVSFYLPACKACKIENISGNIAPPSNGPAIYVANHRSSIDALLLLSLLPPTSLVIKARHVRKPGYACLVKFFDFVPIAASAYSRLQKSLDKCRSLLAQGQNLLLFPEGMRISSETVMPFAEFTFKLAVECKVPIIPVVLQADQHFLNREKGSFFPPKIVRFSIRFLEPVTPESGVDPAHLADTVTRRMTAVFNPRKASTTNSHPENPEHA